MFAFLLESIFEGIFTALIDLIGAAFSAGKTAEHGEPLTGEVDEKWQKGQFYINPAFADPE